MGRDFPSTMWWGTYNRHEELGATQDQYSRTSAMQLAAAITLLILTTAIIVAAQNVTFTNTTTTVITTVIMTTTNNRTNATTPPAPPPNMTTVTTSATTPTTTSSRMTTLPTLSATWGPLMYCWFPCYGGGCGGYPLPQSPPIGGALSWWFGFQFRWSRFKPRQGCPCPTGSCNRRRKGC